MKRKKAMQGRQTKQRKIHEELVTGNSSKIITNSRNLRANRKRGNNSQKDFLYEEPISIKNSKNRVLSRSSRMKRRGVKSCRRSPEPLSYEEPVPNLSQHHLWSAEADVLIKTVKESSMSENMTGHNSFVKVSPGKLTNSKKSLKNAPEKAGIVLECSRCAFYTTKLKCLENHAVAKHAGFVRGDRLSNSDFFTKMVPYAFLNEIELMEQAGVDKKFSSVQSRKSRKHQPCETPAAGIAKHYSATGASIIETMDNPNSSTMTFLRQKMNCNEAAKNEPENRRVAMACRHCSFLTTKLESLEKHLTYKHPDILQYGRIGYSDFMIKLLPQGHLKKIDSLGSEYAYKNISVDDSNLQTTSHELKTESESSKRAMRNGNISKLEVEMETFDLGLQANSFKSVYSNSEVMCLHCSFQSVDVCEIRRHIMENHDNSILGARLLGKQFPENLLYLCPNPACSRFKWVLKGFFQRHFLKCFRKNKSLVFVKTMKFLNLLDCCKSSLESLLAGVNSFSSAPLSMPCKDDTLPKTVVGKVKRSVCSRFPDQAQRPQRTNEVTSAGYRSLFETFEKLDPLAASETEELLTKTHVTAINDLKNLQLMDMKKKDFLNAQEDDSLGVDAGDIEFTFSFNALSTQNNPNISSGRITQISQLSDTSYDSEQTMLSSRVNVTLKQQKKLKKRLRKYPLSRDFVTSKKETRVSVLRRKLESERERRISDTQLHLKLLGIIREGEEIAKADVKLSKRNILNCAEWCIRKLQRESFDLELEKQKLFESNRVLLERLNAIQRC